MSSIWHLGVPCSLKYLRDSIFQLPSVKGATPNLSVIVIITTPYNPLASGGSTLLPPSFCVHITMPIAFSKSSSMKASLPLALFTCRGEPQLTFLEMLVAKHFSHECISDTLGWWCVFEVMEHNSLNILIILEWPQMIFCPHLRSLFQHDHLSGPLISLLSDLVI